MSRDLGRDVPDLEKLYAGKLWADFSYPNVKAINHIGTVPDMQGRLLNVINQVRTFEQSLLRVMKGCHVLASFMQSCY